MEAACGAFALALLPLRSPPPPGRVTPPRVLGCETPRDPPALSLGALSGPAGGQIPTPPPGIKTPRSALGTSAIGPPTAQQPPRAPSPWHCPWAEFPAPPQGPEPPAEQ
ncbi:uracil-DNA glycosylase [Platysternon megacephalum]|uniref:Uracil-DNA glycosylase n=1 Tax=Platysternon megacephalum TaxID=55544 RepID=A0A4D9DFX6_9SAUR|nr:uracil-DNA glycosylase [Platysternon megacephalum]